MGSLLEVKIDNFFEGGPLKCKGKVVRCQSDKTHKSEWQKYYELGIEFLEMDQDQHKYLVVFVERLMELEAKRG